MILVDRSRSLYEPGHYEVSSTWSGPWSAEPADRVVVKGMTPCMPCSFGPLRHPRSQAVRPAHRPSPSDRGCPLDTVGDRCLWHAGGTAGQNDAFPAGGDGSQFDRRARSVFGDPSPRGQEPGGLAADRWGDSNSTSPVSPARGQEAIGQLLPTWALEQKAAAKRQLGASRSGVRQSGVLVFMCSALVLTPTNPFHRPSRRVDVFGREGRGPSRHRQPLGSAADLWSIWLSPSATTFASVGA
jgi:hypothetical protein